MKKLLCLWKPILVQRSMDTLNHRLHHLWKNSEAARVARPQMAFPLNNLLLKFLLLILGLNANCLSESRWCQLMPDACEQMEFVKILKPMIFSDGSNASSPGPSKYLEKQICLLKYGWRARCVCVCVCFNARRFKNEYLAKFVFLQTGVKNQGSDRHVFRSPGPCSEGQCGSHLSQLKVCVVCCVGLLWLGVQLWWAGWNCLSITADQSEFWYLVTGL